MKSTAELYKEELAKIPDEVKIELDLSFAIADKINEILQKRNMSQKELAKRMHKTDAEVSRWLGGTHNFTLRTLAKISAVLQTPLLMIE